MLSSKLILIMGGARSGKSAYALSFERSGMRKAFLATAEPGDAEMAARIQQHRQRRPAEWVTIEEPIEVPARLQALEGQFDLAVVDCLTLWLSNLTLRGAGEEEVLRRADALLTAARGCKGTVVFVTNEVGLGVVPETALGRTFRDLAGLANQRVAQAADEVYLMVAGYPLVVKR